MAGKGKGLLGRVGKALFNKKPSDLTGYDASANKAIPKSVSAFRDMINGGGAGMEGPRFEGGPISGLLNTIGVKPLGYNDRAANYQEPPTAGQASRRAVPPVQIKEENPNLAMELLLQGQAAQRPNLGPFDPRVSTGQVDWGDNAFGPLSSMSGAQTNVMPTTVQPVGAPYSSDGELGFKPLPQFGGNANGLPPKGMSELAYTNWLRNSPVFNIDKASQQGIKMMYDKYRSNPMFQ
jgi:hypothetical protein